MYSLGFGVSAGKKQIFFEVTSLITIVCPMVAVTGSKVVQHVTFRVKIPPRDPAAFFSFYVLLYNSSKTDSTDGTTADKTAALS